MRRLPTLLTCLFLLFRLIIASAAGRLLTDLTSQTDSFSLTKEFGSFANQKASRLGQGQEEINQLGIKRRETKKRNVIERRDSKRGEIFLDNHKRNLGY